jgi:uncharacterized protein YbaR (Trm112 family)
MNAKIIELFKCPKCRANLELRVCQNKCDNIIISGQVACTNGHEFNIKNKVLILFTG